MQGRPARGSLADSIGLTFVPDARMVVTMGYNGGTIATMKLDGSEMRTVGSLGGTLMDLRHPVRGPNGLFAGIDVGPDIKTHIAIIDTTGSSRMIPVAMPIGSEQNWPRISPDGQWVYFSGCDWTIYEACRVWRTHLDGSSPSILTPSHSSQGNRSNRIGLTPDGRTLIYGDHAMIVHVLDIASGVDRSLGVTGVVMALDPSGTRVAAVGEDYKLRIINLDGTGLRDVPTPLTFANFLAPLEWTSDGAWVIAEYWQTGSYGSLIGSNPALVNVTNGAVVGLHYRVPVAEFVTDR